MGAAPKIGLVCATLVACATTSACAGSPEASLSQGCHEEIWEGVGGLVRPETSDLTCAAIKKLIEFRPSEPQRYLVMGESPHIRWKCRLNSAQGHVVLLRCIHHRKHFSVVKST